MIICCKESGLDDTHFIGFVIVLWVVFEHFCLLLVIEVADEIIEPKIFSPLLGFDEPMPGLSVNVIRSSRRRRPAYIFSARETSNFRALRNRS